MIKYRPIPGLDGYYAGSDGSIQSRKSGKGRRPQDGRTLAVHIRPTVSISQDSYVRTYPVSQLVALAWKKDIPTSEKEIKNVEHKNGDPTDNRPGNLFYTNRRRRGV